MITYQPEGIIITISARMIKEKGYKNWLRNFLQTMALHGQEFTYWMRQGNKPRPEMEINLAYVYLCIGNKVRFRAYYGGCEGPCEKTFADGNGGTKTMFGNAWIILAGPVERPPHPIPMKGFQGFRYTDKLW